ncbi:Zinc finger, CCHC-type [Sesbania bispinosa]|nr:Zinc finger, CCHC-type [Sesbania bispinosa]
MNEFCEGSCVSLDDDNIDINVTGDEFDVNHSEDENDSGGPSVEEELGRMDHRGKRMEDLTLVDIRNMEFASEEHGEIFYRAYAKRHGFVVRKDEIDRDIKGNVIMRQFVCNKEGSRNKKHLMRVDRKKEHRPLMRLDCQAKIRIRLDYKTDKWKVVSFVETHNHELTPSTFVHLLPSNRGLNNADKAQVGRLHAYGVRTCHIMGYMLDQKGGYGSLGFCRKDLYNYIERQKLEKIKDGDAHSALCYIQAKANNDPTLRASFLASEDGGAFQRLGCIAKEKKEYFNDIIDDVLKLVHKYETIGEPHGRQTSSEKIVKDPAVVKTKGAPPKRKYGRKRRRCSNCNRTGHIISKCPKLYGRDQQKMDDVNEDEGNISLDEVNVDGMEPSDQTQRLNNNEVNVKISGRHKEKEKDCTQDVEVKVSGTHEGKEKECTQVDETEA